MDEETGARTTQHRLQDFMKRAARGFARSRFSWSPERLFLLIAPILFTAYALLTPPFQTPDEQQHLFRAWQLSQLHLFGERKGDAAGGVLPDSLGRAALSEVGTLEPHATSRPTPKRPIRSLFARSTPVQDGASPRFFNFLGAVVYSPAGYIPQVGAIWTGEAVGLSVENIVRLGRLLNAVLAILLIFLSIRITPVGARVLFCVGLLPMTAAASAAFGQDGIVIGASCLLTAIGLRTVCDGGHARSGLLVTAALALSLALSKMLYIPIAMIGAQPFLREGIKWKRLFGPSSICILAAAVAALWLEANSSLTVTPRAGIPPAAERVTLWLHHPSELLMLLERTYVEHGSIFFDELFTFGWLNVGPVRAAEFVSAAAFLLVLIAGDPAADRLNWQTRTWLALIAAAIVILISLVLCLYWTNESEDWIQGIQGRYFVPTLPLLLIALLPKRTRTMVYGPIAAFLMICANVSVLTSIARTYYSF